MTIADILLPVFVQVLLTFVILLSLGPSRFRSARDGIPRDAEVDDSVWPARTRAINNCFRNQFELPVLFYVLVVLAIITKKADLLFVVLSWIFVLLRIVHAYVHTGSNNLNYRFPPYLLCAAVLFLMWAIFALRILLAPVIL